MGFAKLELELKLKLEIPATINVSIVPYFIAFFS